MKKQIYILFLFCISVAGFAQLKTYSFEEADSLQQVQKKEIIIFIHTDWCGFCQAMQATTFKNREVIRQLNNTVYFVDFNAEDKRTVSFNKRKFRFRPSGNNAGVHELAIELGTIKGEIQYPVLCVLNENREIIFQHSGFLNAKDFGKLLDKIGN